MRVPILLSLLALSLLSGCRNPDAQFIRTPPRADVRAARVADSTTFTTGEFKGCAPEGDGGDPDLNRRKNRDVPPPAYKPMTVADILANNPREAADAGRALRSNWPAPARDEIAPWEQTGVQVEGYLLKARREGPESCNCHSQDDRDFHIWLAANAGDDRANSVVVEISPRVQAKHAGWTAGALQDLSRSGARVRISGWLMWDQEHPEQVGKTRGTLWEIHPIHKIEVEDGGGWREL